MEKDKDKPEQSALEKAANVSKAELGNLTPNLMKQRHGAVVPSPQSHNQDQIKGVNVDSAALSKAVERMEQNPGLKAAVQSQVQSKDVSDYRKGLQQRGQEAKQQTQERGKTPDRSPDR